jgi:hypothetical protein
MPGIQILLIDGKEILRLDYSGLKEEGMIALFEEARIMVEAKQVPIRVLSVFNEKNFATPAFMRYVERNLKLIEPLIIKNTIVGLSQVQMWILAGINLWYKSQIHPFNAEAEAIDFLLTP